MVIVYELVLQLVYIIYYDLSCGHNTKMPKESVDLTFTSDETPGTSSPVALVPGWSQFFRSIRQRGVRRRTCTGTGRKHQGKVCSKHSSSLSIRPSIELQEGISILRMLCYGEYGGLVSRGFWGRDARVDQS